MTGLPKPTEDGPAVTGVTCAKCEHLNPHGHSTCEVCGAHLHVVCHHCGHRNERVRTRCSECHHHLHRSFWKRLSHRLTGKKGKISLFQIILLLIGILIGIGAIIFFAEMRLPEPQAFYAPLFPTQLARHAE
jgi:hypothetical protein